MTTDLAIQTCDLTRDFARAGKGASALRALDGLTLGVPTGIVFGFLGPNGAGKTTTIRLLLGLLDPTAGSATVLGLDTRTDAAEIRARCGALLEHPGLYERMSVEDNLELYGRIWHMPASARRDRIKELLSEFGLWERRREVLGDWSRGMKQKVAVARAMLHRPRLMFFDEPTAGLDPVAAGALRGDLANLAVSEGVTVFLTTHNLSEAEKLCSLVAVIRDGRLIALGSPDELRARSGRPRVKVVVSGLTAEVLAGLATRPEVTAVSHGPGFADGAGSVLLELAGAGDVSVSALVAYLVEAGVRVEEVRKGRASFEEAFLSFVAGDEDEALGERGGGDEEAGPR